MTDSEKAALMEEVAALRKSLAIAQDAAVKAEAAVREIKRQIEEITRPFLAKG